MDYKALYEAAQAEIRTLEMQIKYGDEPSWLQSKIASQRVALRNLNRRVVAQRFELRTINGLDRGLTPEERQAAYESDSKKELVDLTLV